MARIPTLVAQYNVYVDGGSKLLGLAEVTLPSFEGLAETLKGAGLMGEISEVVPGQFGPLTIEMTFRMLYGDVLRFSVGSIHHFDLRSALQIVDSGDYESKVSKERFSVMGQVQTINPGTRRVAGLADASITIGVRRVEHYVDGEKMLEFDPLNDVYKVGRYDPYAPYKAAVS